MAYRNVKGNDRAKNYLMRAMAKGVFSHAYLFEGQAGVGKLDTAREFAKALNCREGGDEACDHCISCRKADLGSHPDIIEIGPDGRSIKNGQVKALQSEMHLKPYESRRKVFIIDCADTMTPQAQNSLLKVLEDPPASCVVILVSSNPAGLLQTVKSRCQRLHFGGNERWEDSVCLDASGAEPFEGEESTREGSMVGEYAFGFARHCLDGDIKSMLEFSEALSKLDHGDCIERLEKILICFRDLSIYKETKNGKFVINHGKMNEIKNLERKADGKALYKVVEAFMDAIEEINKIVNRQMAVDHLILKIQEALQ